MADKTLGTESKALCLHFWNQSRLKTIVDTYCICHISTQLSPIKMLNMELIRPIVIKI